VPWKPRLGLKANAFSGNQQRGGRALGTFNPLFPRLNVEGQFIVPSNLLELYPSITVEPFEGLSIGLGWDFLWRESTQDAIYGPPFLAYPRTAQSTGRPVGNQFVAEAFWQLDRRFALQAFFVHFTAGETITQAGGTNAQWLMVSGLFKF
jgi:hypothetical protein